MLQTLFLTLCIRMAKIAQQICSRVPFNILILAIYIFFAESVIKEKEINLQITESIFFDFSM